MQKIFFTVLLVVTVLVTIRLNNYKPESSGLFANTAATETLIPDAAAENINNSPQKRPTEDDNGEFKEEHPEITAGDEETRLDEE